MLVQQAINERRKPLTKQQQQRKTNELAVVSARRPDKVYGLAVGPATDPLIFYVGISKNPHTRFQAHLRGIANQADLKDAYEWVRYHRLRDTLHLIVLDPDGEFTEEDWRIILTDQGHPLQNAAGGVDCKRKNREADKLRPLLEGIAPAKKREISPGLREWMMQAYGPSFDKF